MDGYTIYARLKERLGDPVVVAISGFYSDELVEELLSKGVRGFLKKPFTRRELESMLQQVLRGSQ